MITLYYKAVSCKCFRQVQCHVVAGSFHEVAQKSLGITGETSSVQWLLHHPVYALQAATSTVDII